MLFQSKRGFTMANSGGKNAILLVIAVAAIGGAIYFLTSMKTENPQDQNLTYFIDPESVLDDPQDFIAITAEDLRARQGEQLLSTPEADDRRKRAGVCPHCEKLFPLFGHGQRPPNCPVCKESLEDE